jgi:hypothetical protein
VGQIVAIAFFAAVLVGIAAILFLTIKDNLNEILAALRGELPARATARPWVRSVRATARPRPAQPQRATAQRRAAV